MGRPERAEALDVKCKEAVLRAEHPAQSESRAVFL
jgi:hypothetical protein